MNASKLLKTISGTIVKHSPEILTTIGVIGSVAATIIAIKSTPKVNFVIDEATKEKGEDLTTKEKVKLYTKGYWKVILIGCLSITCFVASNYISNKHFNLLNTAYLASTEALSRYEKKTEEVVGKKKKAEIDDAIAKEEINKQPISECSVQDLGNGTQVFKDIWSGRVFKSNMAHVQAAFNSINKLMLEDMSVCLNEYYMSLGIDTNGCGEYYGWNNECCSLLKPIFTVDEDTGVIGIQFNESPVFNLYYS